MTVDAQDGLILGGEFATPSRDQWLKLAEGVLKGKAFDKVLVSRLYDGIDVQPLYTAADFPTATDPGGVPGAAPFVRGASPINASWDVRQRVDVGAQPAEANAQVLHELERGATSVLLGLHGVPVDQLPGAVAAALEGVYLDLAGVVLDAGAAFASATAAVLALDGGENAIGNSGADPLVYGGALADAVAIAQANVADHRAWRAFVVDASVFTDGGASDVQALGCSLASAVTYLRAMVDAGASVADAADQIEFRYAIGTDQFAGIALLRAARRCWARVTEACGQAVAQHQHAITSSAMMTQRDPWVNLLRTTIACFTAGVGGADAVTVQPFDAAIGTSDGFSRRLARNIQALLLDESNLGRVADPAGGSFYVESLTDQLAHGAWAWFQEIERAGGMAAAIDAGLIAERIGTTWQARLANLARRKDAITGVSEFPDIAERPVTRPASPAATVAVVTPHRYAEAFEALRDRADRAPARPRIFLANLGPVAVHTARATFAKNFFEVAGIETINTDGFDSPVAVEAAFAASGATMACICSSDGVYEERAEAVARALHDAGATRVYLAGRHEAPGVDEHIYSGCDALATLTRALDALGAK